jgi:subtilisin family serine protease
MDATQAAKVAKWGFVRSVEMTRDNSEPASSPKKRQIESRFTEIAEQTQLTDYTDNQLATYNLTPLHNLGYEGQGILMAVCDGAFHNTNTLSCFRQSQELGHFDFTDDSKYGYTFYGSKGTHGTEWLSTISGIMEGYYGAATQAQYYLMKSEEDDTESPKEMDNMVVALETADSLGVNIFSVSLGYSQFDNPSWTLDKSDLDGRTTRVSVAATIAARKGMLVCVAAGNDGNNPWQTISAPADADSVLTVGAVDTLRTIGAFSSHGPAADGRVKPDVCAAGVQTALINPSGTIINSNGTSFATPMLAGLAACLWSALPTENAMQIRERILRSADRYSTPDATQYGYGIPDAWVAYTMDMTPVETIYEEEPPRKLLQGEQILILRHGHVYNLAGQRVE